MPEVGVERLAARHDEEDGPQHQEAMPPVTREEVEPGERAQAREHGRHGGDLGHPQNGEDREPHEHDRTEHGAEARRPPALDEEEADEDCDGKGQHERLEDGGGNLEALHRAQDRDGRRDHAIAVEERGAEKSQRHDDVARLAPPSGARRMGQGHEGEDPPFSPVVGAEDEDEVLDRDDEDEGPEDQREHAQDVGRRDGDGVGAVKTLPHRVERARPDVAVHDAEGAQGEGEEGRVFEEDSEEALWAMAPWRCGPSIVPCAPGA